MRKIARQLCLSPVAFLPIDMMRDEGCDAMRCDAMCAVIPKNTLEIIIDDPFLEGKERKGGQETSNRDIKSHSQPVSLTK